ncbi:hypothetical protein R70006_04553 [Paraburkholderia domus]|jgi:hypothetical protein|nr:hypothetical protein R70006_04553 [Paraburkholderia domus]
MKLSRGNKKCLYLLSKQIKLILALLIGSDQYIQLIFCWFLSHFYKRLLGSSASIRATTSAANVL